MPVFGIEQSGSIVLRFVLSSVLRLSNGPSSSRTSFYNVFLDSGVKHPYYMPSPLITFNAHVTCYHISVFIYSVQFFIVPYSPGTVNLYWLKYAAKFFAVK